MSEVSGLAESLILALVLCIGACAILGIVALAVRALRKWMEK